MVAFSQGVLCGLFRRNRHPLSERRFPRRLTELGACGGYVALEVQASFDREWCTDGLAQGLRSTPQPCRAFPLRLRTSQASEALQTVGPLRPVPKLPV